jgi:phenylacetate-CoA ligase
MNKASILFNDLIKGRKTYSYLKEFERLRYAPRHELEEYRFKKLKNLMIHAAANTEFYKKRFRHYNFPVKIFDNIRQLNDIPPLTRLDLQEHWREMLADNYKNKKLSKGSSSGSTGLPAIYFKDAIATSAGHAANLLGWLLSGWNMNLKGLHIWGNPSTVNNEWRRLSSRIKAKIFRHHKFPAYRLTSGNRFHELHETIVKQKYQYLDGYTNAIYLYADYLRERNISVHHIVRYVFTTAENLQEYQRKAIEETIASVYDMYGCSEINGIAYECKDCNNYHVIEPHVYVEYDGNIGDSELSPLLITDLDNYAFPLIRYKNDDLAEPLPDHENRCPVKFSALRQVAGRESDIIRFRDGGTLSVPSFFGSMLLKQIDGIKQYQIERVEDDLIHVNFVKNDKYSERDHETVKSALEEYLNGKIRYEIKFVDKIQLAKTGKFKLLLDRTANK